MSNLRGKGSPASCHGARHSYGVSPMFQHQRLMVNTTSPTYPIAHMPCAGEPSPMMAAWHVAMVAPKRPIDSTKVVTPS